MAPEGREGSPCSSEATPLTLAPSPKAKAEHPCTLEPALMWVWMDGGGTDEGGTSF